VYDVHDYEVTYILNPTMSDEDVTAMNERIGGLITTVGGEIVDVHSWGGKRRLAYPIERHRDGYYMTIKFRSTGEAEQGLYGQIKLIDNVIRHGVFRMDDAVAAAATQQQVQGARTQQP